MRETHRREGSLLSLGLGLFIKGTSMWKACCCSCPFHRVWDLCAGEPSEMSCLSMGRGHGGGLAWAGSHTEPGKRLGVGGVGKTRERLTESPV